jgi:hypothetical protein
MDSNFLRVIINSDAQYNELQSYLASEGFTEMNWVKEVSEPVRHKPGIGIVGISRGEKTVHQISNKIIDVLRRYQTSIYPAYCTYHNNADLFEFLEIHKTTKRVYKKKRILGADGTIYDSAMDYLLVNQISPRNIHVLYNALHHKKKYKGKEISYYEQS